MKTHTDAYYRLKRQIEDAFDFAVIVCYAVPLLKRQIKAIEEGKMAPRPFRPDYFVYDKTSREKMREKTANYKSALSSYILLSSFSFFEAYVNSAIKELIDFHGGKTEFIAIAERRARKFMSLTSNEIKNHKRRLQEPIKPSKIEKYEKHTKALKDLGYRFPTELFSAYGVLMLIKKLKRLKSHNIPYLLRDGLHMDLDDKTIKEFHKIRDKRNKIAHGTIIRLSLKEVMGMNRYLNDLAQKIDQHLVKYFLVIEKFA